ncbi:MAG: energy transducer TonB [Chitinispirillaceae bacterium]|nr:energy transducer TonB [Chitinispirillaceae bacterium]
MSFETESGSFSGGSISMAASPALIRQVRGSMFQSVDPRFFFLVTFSALLHIGIIYYAYRIKVPPPHIVDIEKVPDRFARLIIEKPIPKTDAQKKMAEKQAQKIEPKPVVEKKVEPKPGEGAPKISAAQREKARKSVAVRAARVEQRMRSVGVLGMLTGVGATAKGPAVVDVLGAMGTRKESTQNLDDALAKMSGLRQADNEEILQKKLVKSKDVAVQHKEEIDDLIASVGTARSVDLAKRGEFVIQKPESIEGAASSNVKRDNNAINAVVASHKASIRMSYEKYLKRDPSLAGKVTVRFTITASGGVSTVSILENSTGSADLEQEITRKIRMWRFESIPEGDVTVTYPFVFTPAT